MLEETTPQTAAPAISKRPVVLEMENSSGGAGQNLSQNGKLTVCKGAKAF